MGFVFQFLWTQEELTHALRPFLLHSPRTLLTVATIGVNHKGKGSRTEPPAGHKEGCTEDKL